MRSTDRAAFKTLLTDALAFYRRDASDYTLSVWWQACQPFDLEQVRKALTTHAMDPERGNFAPMPADIVRELAGTYTDRAVVAWGKVWDAIRRVGVYTSVAFDDPAIHSAAEDCGGWIAMCSGQASELPHLQRRFMESYRAHAKRPDEPHPPYLPGLAERDNGLRGREIAPPTLVGDQAAARRVMDTGSTARAAITAPQLPMVRDLIANGVVRRAA